MTDTPRDIGVGVIGCGNISTIYLTNLTQRFTRGLKTIAVADLMPERAQAAAEKFPVKAMAVKDLLADPSIDLVVNLTVPGAHHEVAMDVVNAGKSVYNEKPLTLSRTQAAELLTAAGTRGVLVGGAPDTFLGGGIQTCRKLIDDGWIGKPVAATAFFLSRGPEGWHPNPVFYYSLGGGPMFDMGPYYLTAMVALMGGVRRVTGSAQTTFATRVANSQHHKGLVINVQTPTHIAGVLDFASGAVGTIVTSFDVWCHSLPRIEVYGTEGTLSVPDPNTFGGPVKIRRAGVDTWSEVPLTHGYAVNSRGLGVADLARALQARRAARAGGALCHHVLDIMHAVHDASLNGRHVDLTSTVDRPAPLPMGLTDGEVD
ncbi:MAG: Gfo/Idh/MocA family oxidoreductase [Planctomycetes bacterium]|nr:Gfo/Idh/MocA family oxidoreductase [Planctomycetota bacterium]